MTVIGVISDTHGQLRPEAVEALRGSGMILHAGDVGVPEILDELARIAPVKVVRGNVDRGEWVREREIPDTELVEVDGVGIYMVHNIEELDVSPAAAGIAAVVYGHSHQPKVETKGGVLYFNPGSAGPRRFKLPVAVGKLYVERGAMRGEIVELEVE
jgi:putative phosphoesterase